MISVVKHWNRLSREVRVSTFGEAQSLTQHCLTNLL